MSGVEHRFGPYGGQYVPETLDARRSCELEQAWIARARIRRYPPSSSALLRDYVGRPTPLYLAERLSERVGHEVYLKREDLNHTGAHKINNALGQACSPCGWASAASSPRPAPASTASPRATACALLGLECIVYMGTEDMRRQAPNVERMGLLGATRASPSRPAARTLKEAVSAAIRDWVANVGDTHYVIGSVRRAGAVPGARARPPARDRRRGARAAARGAGRLPDRVIACVGGGSNAIGMFDRVRRTSRRRLVGVEAGGRGDRDRPPRRAADRRRARRRPARRASRRSCRTRTARSSRRTRSRAGLDYPGVGPEHAWLRDSGPRDLRRRSPTPRRCAAFQRAGAAGGHHPGARVRARDRLGAAGRRERPATLDLVCLSGRGDKDLAEVLANARA